jgi:hypothetical protein
MNASIRNNYERSPRYAWRLVDIGVATKDSPGEREVTVTMREAALWPDDHFIGRGSSDGASTYTLPVNPTRGAVSKTLDRPCSVGHPDETGDHLIPDREIRRLLFVRSFRPLHIARRDSPAVPMQQIATHRRT